MATNFLNCVEIRFKNRADEIKANYRNTRARCNSILSHVFTIIKKLGYQIDIEDLHTKVFISGSSINSLLNNMPFHDFDIWFYEQRDLDLCKTNLINNRSNRKRVIFDMTENIIDMMIEGRDLQFILIDAGDPDEITEKFDWSIGSAYATFGDLGTPNIFNDSSSKDIKVTGSRPVDKPYSSMMRLVKYLGRGWEFKDEKLQMAYIDGIIKHVLDTQEKLNEEEVSNGVLQEIPKLVSKEAVIKAIRKADPGYYKGKPRYTP